MVGDWFSNLIGGGWLSGQTKGLCDKLQYEMEPSLKDFKTHGATANDNYNKVALNLDNPKIYQGKGAQAFLSAVNTDINRSKPLLDSFGHAASAAGTLASSIAESSFLYDGKIARIPIPSTHTFVVPARFFDKWRDNLMNIFFKNMSDAVGSNSDLLSDLFQNGGPVVNQPWSAAVNTVRGTVDSDAEQWATDPLNPSYDSLVDVRTMYTEPSSTFNVQTRKKPPAALDAQVHKAFMDTFNDMSGEAYLHVWNWANALQTDYLSFQSTLRNTNNLTARDLFDMFSGMGNNDGTQNTDKPITITPYTSKDGKQGLLITIGGTDSSHWTYDTNLFDALQTGQNGYNPYKVDVENAIIQYMKEHPEMAGAELTFAGYSYGGMTAQQLTDEIDNGQALGQYHLHVAQVVTYGAPVMGPPQKNVRYDMYDATYDPIPLLSSYENPELSQIQNPLATSPNENPLQTALGIMLAPFAVVKDIPAASVAAGTLIGVDQLPWDVKLHGYIDPSGQYNGEIHNISDVGSDSPIGSGGPPFFTNHMQYQNSDQLNASTTANTDIDPGTLGPTEYFGMSNTDNVGSQATATGIGIEEGILLALTQGKGLP